MLPRRQRQQHIILTCVVEHNDRILLLRGSEYLDDASREHIGYFGLPRFTLTFGSDPEALIARELYEQFGQTAVDLSVLTVAERMVDDATQAVELVYRVSVERPERHQTRRFFFAPHSRLEHYLFPDELRALREYLECDDS